MYSYHLVSVWKVKAYQEDAWKSIYEQEKWIRWWPGIKNVTLVNEGESTNAKTYHHIWKGILLTNFNCHLRVTTTEKPSLIEATASGDLQGKMKWEIKQDGDTTIVTCTADLNIAKPWINKYETYLKSLFLRKYNAMMQKGAKALSKRLQAKFVVCKNSIHARFVPSPHELMKGNTTPSLTTS